MRRSPLVVGIPALVILTTACFHQKVHSGLTPSDSVVQRDFVSTWLWGIVPADTVDMRRECPSGVATVETRQTFLNGLVAALTLGIYTPQSLRVTCATGA